jgi:hypothetical protein
VNDASAQLTNNTVSAAAAAKNSNSGQSQQPAGKSVFSPFDEKEEWNKISKIIDSFGADIGASVKTSTTPNNCKYLK